MVLRIKELMDKKSLVSMEAVQLGCVLCDSRKVFG